MGKLRQGDGMQCAQDHTVRTQMLTRDLPPGEEIRSSKTWPIGERPPPLPLHPDIICNKKWGSLPHETQPGPSSLLKGPQGQFPATASRSSTTFIPSWHGPRNMSGFSSEQLHSLCGYSASTALAGLAPTAVGEVCLWRTGSVYLYIPALTSLCHIEMAFYFSS